MRPGLLFLVFLLADAQARGCTDVLLARSRNLGVYGAQMDASLAEKLSRLEPWIPRWSGAVVADVGTGTGAVAAALAVRHPQVRFVGIDRSLALVPAGLRLENLSFSLGVAEAAYGTDFAAAIYSSIFHEIYSYAGDSPAAVAQSMRSARDSLAAGGRLLLRDFVRPRDAGRRVILRHAKEDQSAGHTFADFARAFGRTVACRVLDETRFETDMASAYEFIYRKDYTVNWSAELAERYGWADEDEIRGQFERAGFRIVHEEAVDNAWIIANRLAGKVALFDAGTGAPLPLPTYQRVVVAEKISTTQ